jgi:hypothetical protein
MSPKAAGRLPCRRDARQFADKSWHFVRDFPLFAKTRTPAKSFATADKICF